ncbi:hypothetical protein J3R30DRAFT_1606228 [Lentinula aciculospora]|uniref:RING-type domain-containing protein n=1 Tax=Lentinula aciculospora TaxID=153920 RepID=A0A9W9DG66_9AGAR|nr:hypothetical protein J3R30DRAFT_1606228 [Lentinula aciculospora]
MSAQPATPQRTTSHSHSHSVSVSLPHGLSPVSPYTPLSLRSFASASTSSGSLNPSPSSTLATPASVRNLNNHAGFSSPPVVRVKKISWASPSPAGHSPSDSLPSIADLARNWRSRANENGIKVANNSKQNSNVDFSLLDEGDASFTSDQVCDDEEALLPAPFMSTQRRRSLSHAGSVSQHNLPMSTNAPHSAPRARTRPPLAPLSPVTRRMAPSSPVQARRPSLANHQNVMATPPPNRQLAERLRLKGSLTDPAQLRRREVYDAVLPPNDVSFDRDLFDIHEDEHDGDYELAYDSYHHDLHDYLYQPEHSASMRETHSDFEEEQYEVEYPTLPHQQKQNQNQYYYHYQQQPLLPPSYRNPQTTYSHPPGLGHPAATRGSTYAASMVQNLGVPMFHETQLLPQYPMQHVPQLAPAHIPMQLPRHQALSSSDASHHASSNASSKASTPVPIPAVVSKATAPLHCCSICARKPPSLTRLAILTPCGHALCPTCLTSALNIVGEKDMECAGCRAKVADFKLVSINADEAATEKAEDVFAAQEQKRGFRDNSLHIGNLDEVSPTFDISSLNESDLFSDENVRASTPPPKVKGMRRDSGLRPVPGAGQAAEQDPVVLRIDNVPWDITPPRISVWLDQPIVRVHVLLDKKGKTMSHAFVEVENEAMAGKILRGEVQGNGPRRGSVLGKGKRARGVTVTRSSQGELMSALFPSWLGSFDGARPSLAGIENDRVVAALESGLMTESEVACLLYLIRSPDAHFLKVPSLPFHLLISVLAKFPADIDSRVFWSSSLRDILFDVVFAAVQVLIARTEQRKNLNDGAYPDDLVEILTKVALNCQVFTSQQKSKLAEFLNEEPSRPLSPCGSDSNHSDVHSSIECPGHADPTDADVEDEDGENDVEGNASLSEESHLSSDEVRTPSSATAANSTSSPPEAGNTASAQDHMRDDIAREFGVETQLVEALIQRLSMTQR